jgi:hypothetical protein
MTIFTTFTDAERQALRLHGLGADRPSQLSDAFVLGMRYQRVTPATVDLFGDGIQRPARLVPMVLTPKADQEPAP